MRFVLPGAAALTAMLLVTGCQAGSPPTPSPSVSEVAADTSARDAAVKSVRALLPTERPERIVTMSVGLTQIIDALGGPLVGVPSSQNPLPDGVKDVERVGNSVEPNLEKIAELRPDLVLSPDSIGESIDKKLKPLNLTTSNLPTDSVEDLTATTLALGEMLGASETASKLVRELQAMQSELESNLAKAEPKKVLMLFGSPGELMVMGEGTFAGEIAKSLGATNIATLLGQTKDYAPLSMEQIVAQNPDTVLILAHGDADTVVKAVKEELAGQGAWEKLAASKTDSLHALPFDLYGISSMTNAPEAFRDMAQALGS